MFGVDINGHVGEGNRGDEEVMGGFAIQKDKWRETLEKEWKWLE